MAKNNSKESVLRAEQAKLLQRGVDEMALAVSDEQQQKMLNYLSLLEKWNRTYNLTAVRDPLRMVSRHLLDSLTVVPYIIGCANGNRVLDVGSGAGLPGVPLAILFPAHQFVLLDSSGKKSRFITQAINTLEIGNVEVHNGRVERYGPELLFDLIVTRAFSDIGQMIELTAHLLRADGQWLAMKGQFPQAELELAAVADRCGTPIVTVVALPGDDAARHIVQLRPKGDQ